MKNIDVIVVGQNYSTSLGLIQAAGEAGFSCGIIKSIVNVPKRSTPELLSDYVVKTALCNRQEERAFLDSLCKNFRKVDGKIVLLPADDYTVALVDKYRETLSRYYYLPSINGGAGSLSQNMDKFQQGKIASDAGLKTALSWVISAGSTIIPEDMEYPCITKPQMSVGSPKSFIKKCINQEELYSALLEIKTTKPCPVLIEEFIDVRREFTIPGISYNGTTLIPAFIRKQIIGKGIHRGVTISGEVLDSSHFPGDLLEKLVSFVRKMGYEGIFDIELFLTDNGFYFNEMNLRYGAAGYALTRAGVNLPAIYIRSCLGMYNKVLDKLPKDGLSFVSDKAVLDYLSSRQINYRTYRQIIRGADFRFLVSNKDKGAKKSFQKIERKVLISNIIKGNI